MTIPLRTAVIACLGSLAIGAALVHRLTPERIEEHERAVTLVQRHVAERTREVAHVETVRDRWRTRTIVVETKPDGSSRSVTREEETDHAKVTADVTKDAVRVETQVVQQVVEKERIVTPALPRLMLGAGVGLDVGELRPVWQVDVGYRVAGPLWVAGTLQAPFAGFAPTVTVGAKVTF